MKKKIILLILLVASLILIAETSRKQILISDIVLTILDRLHYEPLENNDDFSENIYEMYLKNLDYSKRFLIQTDIDKLNKYQFKIDDQLKKKEFTFYEESMSIFTQRLALLEIDIIKLLDKPFDYAKLDSLETDPEKAIFCANEAALHDKWRRILKYQTILKYLDLVDTKNSEQDTTETPLHMDFLTSNSNLHEELELEARESIRKRMVTLFRRLNNRTEEEKFALFVNSITHVYDPHTTYMPPLERENFNIDMTGQFEGIGAVLSEQDGIIEVKEIMAGSPSWRQKELEAGDKILKVSQGTEIPVDIVEMPLRDAVKLIRGKRGTEVRLTVRKTSNEVKVIPIIRDVIVMEATYARAALLQENGKNYGYIQLPKFYRDFKNPLARNATEDVKQAILSLGEVDGLMLDLRSNGGGALPDAIGIAGLFLDEGPIVQVKTKLGEPKIDSDKDGETFYDGPLVVMVNKFSASASEIASAALQDYGRAVILGSKHTFGKGTVQTIYGLDRYLNKRFANEGPFGSLKFTYQKYYRANGGSTQFRGVESDIILPDAFDYIETGEREYDFALQWDTIQDAIFNKVNVVDDKIAMISENSHKRVEANEDFQHIINRNELLRERLKKSNRNISISAVIDDDIKIKAEEDQIILKFDENEKLEVSIIEYAPIEKKLDEQTEKDEQQKQDEWLTTVRKDVYLAEAMKVLQDMQ